MWLGASGADAEHFSLYWRPLSCTHTPKPVRCLALAVLAVVADDGTASNNIEVLDWRVLPSPCWPQPQRRPYYVHIYCVNTHTHTYSQTYFHTFCVAIGVVTANKRLN